ncbi:MAG: amino acid ABC transporter ATP-binding protein [Sandaracinaceae bacterium]|nr:amino acid ABC transporter ATP-binding protein [Sandaracinaceae bacterium]
MIGVRELLKRRGDRVVLGGVSFEAPAGERIAVVGPSGGGKTTLLRCMHGLEPFDAGSVRIGDAELGPGAPAKGPLAAIRSRAGFVFQQWHLFAHMTALENVIEAPIHVRHVPRKEAVAKAQALLERVGLSHRADARPRSLSGGEQQRVAIARALAMEPEVLFMDEPTSALDPQRVGSLIELLAQLSAEDDLTLVMVTHDIGFARELATRALVLVDGDIAEAGDPKEVLVDPEDPRTRAFLGLD